MLLLIELEFIFYHNRQHHALLLHEDQMLLFDSAVGFKSVIDLVDAENMISESSAVLTVVLLSQGRCDT